MFMETSIIETLWFVNKSRNFQLQQEELKYSLQLKIKKILTKIALIHIIHLRQYFGRCSLFQVDLKTRVPIYRQVLDNFKRGIYSGALKRDERVPSIRDLAKTLGVNPNTVQKAYRELEEKGYFYTVQGQGSFISSPPDSQVREEIARLYAALKKLKEELLMHGEAIEDIIRFLKDREDVSSTSPANAEAINNLSGGQND